MTKKKITVVSINENNDNNGDIVANNEVVDDAITTLESIVEEPIIEEQVTETKTEVNSKKHQQLKIRYYVLMS